MNLKPVLSIIGGLLVIACGEAFKLGYTEWAQLKALSYWLGVGTQVGGLLLAVGGGVAYTMKSGQTVDLTRLGKLLLPVFLLLSLTGCAGRLDQLVRLSPMIASEVAAVQTAVEQQKDGLIAADCTFKAGEPQNCYVAFQKGFIEITKYHQAYNDALRALNTTDVKKALSDMAGVASGWVQREVVRLPERIRVWVVLALESLRVTLTVAQEAIRG